MLFSLPLLPGSKRLLLNSSFPSGLGTVLEGLPYFRSFFWIFPRFLWADRVLLVRIKTWSTNSFIIYPRKQLHIGPRDMLPVPWNPLLMQLWHRAISLLSGHTKGIFLKPTASVGTEWTVPGNAKLICGLRTPLICSPSRIHTCSLHSVFPQQGHRVCFKDHHPEANTHKRDMHALLSFSCAPVYEAILPITTE